MLRKFLKEKNLTQKDLAKLVGVTQASISLYVRKVCTPRPETMSKLARALDIDLSQLVECFYKNKEEE